MFTFKQLYQAYLDCRENKRNREDALAFEANQEENLIQLVDELNNRHYQPTTSVCFYIRLPKPREVFAAHFRDRVVHHLIYNILSPIWEKIFIYSSFASRPKKGTHLAAKILQSYLRKITFNGQKPAYYLKMDIKNFFMSIYKPLLYEFLCKKCSDEHLRWLLQIVLFHNPTKDFELKCSKKLQQKVPPHKSLFFAPDDCGLPIGNLTSQFFANIFLNELDHFIKRELKCRYYVRYVDDFILVAASIEQLKHWQNEIEIFLERRLRLELNPEVTRIDSVFNGVDFVGFIVRPFYKLCRRRVVGNCRRALEIMQPKLFTESNSKKIWHFDDHLLKKLLFQMNSYLGHFKHACTKKVILSLYRKFPFLHGFYTLYFHKLKRKYKIPKKLSTLRQQLVFFHQKFKNSLLLLQIGCYYECFGNDARQIKTITGYQLKHSWRGMNCACGFHQRFLPKVCSLLDEKQINYVIIRQTGRYLLATMERMPAVRVEFNDKNEKCESNKGSSL